MYHQKSEGANPNVKGVESYNSLDDHNGRINIQQLSLIDEYAGVDLTGVAKPVVLALCDSNSEPEVLCILDEAEECHPEKYVYYVFPKAEKRHEIFACQYCGVFWNPCSVVVAAKGTPSHRPCAACNTIISGIIHQPDFVFPGGCRTHEEAFEQILEDIRDNSENWSEDKYFIKL